MNPIIDARFVCTTCEDFHLCQNCMEFPNKDMDHEKTHKVVESSVGYGLMLSSVLSSNNTHADAFRARLNSGVQIKYPNEEYSAVFLHSPIKIAEVQ